MTQNEYIEDLKQRLYFRGASRRQVRDIVAEVQSHLADSGEDPMDAFGKPDEYAESVLRGYRWPTARLLVIMLFGVVGGGLVGRAASILPYEEKVVTLRTSEILIWVVLVLAVPLSLMPVVDRRLAGSASRKRGVFLLMVVASAGAVSSFLASNLFGERTIVSLAPPVAFLLGLGTLAALALVAMVWRYLRTARR